MEPRTIVAIEIASSKVKGAVGAIGSDGNLSVLAIEELRNTNNVRYGRIQNIREVSAAVNDIIARLEATAGIAPRRVRSMAVALGGRSLSAQPAKAALRFPHECEITEKHIERLIYEATHDFMGEKNIEATIPRKFYVNNAAMPKAVGTFGETLRGEFMMLTCGKETRANLDRLKYDSIDHDDVTYILRPTAIADFVLSADERQLGTALVDFGAETTTVSVYKDGTLAFLCTIPMGSRLITLDLMTGLSVTEETAESYKLAVGTLADGDAVDANAEEINGYVRARAGEIAANIVNQLELAGYNADNLSQIVLTGGGAALPDFAELLGAQCKVAVRVAQMPEDIAFHVAGRNNTANIDIVALLYAASRIMQGSSLYLPEGSRPIAAVSADEIIVEKEYREEEDDDEDDDEPEVYIPAPEPKREARPASHVPADHRRYMPAEDDDDILDDDDDPEEDNEEEAPKPRAQKRSFFNFGKKKKSNAKEEEEEEYDDDEEEEYDDEEDDDVFADDGNASDDGADENPDGISDDHFGSTKNLLDKYRVKFANFFKGEEDEDENY